MRGEASGPDPAPATISTIAAKTAGVSRADGFVPLYLDAKTGQLWLELPKGGAGDPGAAGRPGACRRSLRGE